MTQALNLLLEAHWTERWRLLAADPRLAHPGVARHIGDVDPVLAMVIDRVSSVGLEQTREEFPVAVGLVSGLSGAEAVAVGVAAVGVAVEQGLWWLAPLLEAAINHLASHVVGEQAEELQQAAMVYLMVSVGAQPESVQEAYRLATADWALVWAELPLVVDPAGLAQGAEVIAQHAELFHPEKGLAGWAADVRDLLVAAHARGHEAAVLEHRMLLTERGVLAEPLPLEAEQAERCADLAADLGGYFQRTGSRWVLEGALRAARAAVQATESTHPDYPRRASNLGILIAGAIRAGILPKADYAEAVGLLRWAVQGTDPTHPDYPGRASNLGGQIADAILAGILPKADYAEAVGLLRRAVPGTDPTHPDYPGRASNLSSLIAGAIWAGILPKADYAEAVGLHRQAVQATDPAHPDYPAHASNLADRIAEAIGAGILPKADYGEAVDLARRAVQGTDPTHPNYPTYASNLGNRIAEAIGAGILPKADYAEAVGLLRRAVRGTGPTHPDYPGYASNLGNLISEAIRAGILPKADYAEAVDFARRAVQGTDPSHPDYRGHASNLGNLISEAIGVGILPKADHVEAVDLLRQAVQGTDPTHPNYPGRASNLGNLIAGAIGAGILPKSDYAEAVDLLRQAVQATDPTHPNYPMCASNLSNLIAGAIDAGILPKAGHAEAVDLQRRAVQATGPTHSDYPGYASNLGNRIAEAIGAGILPKMDYAEAVDLQRQAVQATDPTHRNYPIYASNLGNRISQAIRAGILNATAGAVEMVTLVDGLWQAVRQEAASPRQRRSVLEAAASLSAWAPAVVAVGLGAGEGIRTIESLRNHLAEGHLAPALPDSTAIPSELAASYQQAVEGYERTQQLIRDGLADVRESSRALADLQEVIATVAALPGLGWFGSRPRLPEIAARLDESTLALYLIPGSTEGAALLLDRRGEPGLVRLPRLSRNAVADQVVLLLESPANAQQVAAWLWTAVIQPLLDKAAGRREWVIIPTGHLGMLPWHAAGDAVHGWLDDQASVRVIPSLTMLDAPAGPTAAGPALVGIVAAQELDFLEGDQAVTAEYLPGAAVIPRDAMTVEAVLNGLVEASSAVLSGHARHSLAEGGGLVLADGILSAELVERLPVRSRGLVFLSSCSSGQIAAELADESIGLPNALLHAGFHGVDAALWPVWDRTAFITLARLLQTQREHPDLAPHEQLRQVRRWLRTAITTQLQQWVAELATQIRLNDDSAMVSDLRGWLSRYSPMATPMDDPVDWAAFAYIGR